MLYVTEETMLTEQEKQVLQRIKDQPQVRIETIHSVLVSLDERGYINIKPALSVFGTATGLFLCQVTEAGNAAS